MLSEPLVRPVAIEMAHVLLKDSVLVSLLHFGAMGQLAVVEQVQAG
jgi:hypothetical protein